MGRTALGGLALIGLLALSGCSEKYYLQRGQEVEGGTPIVADVTVAYTACLERCNQPGSYGSLTRDGCLEACMEARRQSGLVDRVFLSRQQCDDAVWALESRRDAVLAEKRDWCDRNYPHIYKRQGCLDAFEVFYTHLTGPEICGGRASGGPASLEPIPVVVPPAVALTPCDDGLSPLIPLTDLPAYQRIPVKITSDAQLTSSPKKRGSVPGGPDKDLPYPACIPEEVPVSRPAPKPEPTKPPVRVAPEKDLPYPAVQPSAKPPVIRQETKPAPVAIRQPDPAPVPAQAPPTARTTVIPPLPAQVPPAPAAVVVEERTVVVETVDTHTAPVSRAAPEDLVIPPLPPVEQVVEP